MTTRSTANSLRAARSTPVMQRQPIARHHMRGFSLIEMVAAFLVFAIGTGVLMQVLATSMRTVRQSSDYTMAALWAQSKLDIVGVGAPIEAGHSTGRFDDTYRWELDISQADAASIEPPPQASVIAGNTQQNPNGHANQAGANPGRYTSASNAGSGGGLQVAPFDLYQIDLTVTWGGASGLRQHTAHFGTLRAQNPDPNGNRKTAASAAQATQVAPQLPVKR